MEVIKFTPVSGMLVTNDSRSTVWRLVERAVPFAPGDNKIWLANKIFSDGLFFVEPTKVYVRVDTIKVFNALDVGMMHHQISLLKVELDRWMNT